MNFAVFTSLQQYTQENLLCIALENRVIFEWNKPNNLPTGPTCGPGENCTDSLEQAKVTKETSEDLQSLKITITQDMLNKNLKKGVRNKIKKTTGGNTYRNVEDFVGDRIVKTKRDLDGNGKQDDFLIKDDKGIYQYNAKQIFKEGIFHSAITGEPAKTKDVTSSTTQKIDIQKLKPYTGVTKEMLTEAVISTLNGETYVDLKDGTSYRYSDIFNDDRNTNTENLENENSKESVIAQFKKIEKKATIQMIKELLQNIQNLTEEEQKDPEIQKIKKWGKYYINQYNKMIKKQEVEEQEVEETKEEVVKEEDKKEEKDKETKKVKVKKDEAGYNPPIHERNL